MKTSLRLRITILLLCVSPLIFPVPAKADSLSNEVVWVASSIAAGALVVIGIGVYFLVRKTPSRTGCAALDRNVLELRNEGDQQTYMLIGDTADIKAGDRVRVKGKNRPKDASGKRSFLVEKLAKDYGPCKVASATP